MGHTVEADGLRQLAHLFLTEIVRDGQVIAPVEPDEIIRAGDLLVFTGDVTRLDLLLQFDGLETHGQHYQLPLDNLVEVVVAADVDAGAPHHQAGATSARSSTPP